MNLSAPGLPRPYYGETREDFVNRITYEFMNREDENTTYPGIGVLIYDHYAPNTYEERMGGITYICSKRKFLIDIKNPIASYLAAERLIPNDAFLGHIKWSGYYHGIGWKNMIAFRWGEGEKEITVKEDK